MTLRQFFGQFFNPIELPPRTLHELGRAKEQPITEAEAKKFASSMGAESYVESSSLTQKNLKEVFDLRWLYGMRRHLLVLMFPLEGILKLLLLMCVFKGLAEI